jgi:hypothetical protein
MKKQQAKNRGSNVVLSKKEYDQLKSRPKQRTLQRDLRGGMRGVKNRQNDYLRALINPFEIQGAKIPDLCSFPSGTNSVYNRQSTTLALASTNYGWVWQPSPYQESSLSTAAGAFSWGAWNQDSIYTGWAPLVHSYRVVSAGLRVRYLGSTLSDSGMVCASLLPTSENFSVSVTSPSDIQNKPQSVCARLADGLEFIWCPQDVQDYEYRVPQFSAATGITQMPAIVVAISGQAANTPVMLEFFYNLEFIPDTRTISYVETTVSPSNPEHLAQAETFMSSIGNALGHAMSESKGSAIVKAAERLLPGLISAGGQYLKYRYSRPSSRFIEYPLD